MSTTHQVDAARQEAFIHKVLDHTSGTMTTLLAVIGERLGLFKNLAQHGSATPRELAGRMSLNERYTREWLSGMASAGYVEYNSTTQSIHAPVRT